MPLVRYEVPCEHSLANPELFRSAARDDPEGLLEGVAVAGLIGIVRQLGDLAEFAAEMFRDLHKELTSVGGRTHDLTVRVQELEVEMPSVEKAILSEPNQLRFAYTNGADWHASIRSDQNHCTSGVLPRFVRNFYEECRGPPRLFLLDKFDAAGSGACLKRYTDPSFFKLEWASSELMKAQRAQRDKKARREKKKGTRRKTGQVLAAISQIPSRVRYGSASLDDLDKFSRLLASTLKDEVGSSSSNQGVSDGPAMQKQRRSNLGPKSKMTGGSLPPTGPSAPQAVGGASKPLNISAKDIAASMSGKFYQPSELMSGAESMAGKISKINEIEDCSGLPAVGFIPRNVDQEIPKDAGGSRLPIIDVEAKVTSRVTKEDLEAAAMARTGRTSRGSSRSSFSADVREKLNPRNSRTSQTSLPDIASKSNAADDSTGGVKFANTRASETNLLEVSSKWDGSLDGEVEVNFGNLRTSTSIPDSTVLSGLQASSLRAGSMGVWDTLQGPGNLSRSSADAKDALVASAGISRLDPRSSSRGGGDFANTPTSSLSEGLSVVDSEKERVDGTYKAEDSSRDSHRSLDSHHSCRPAHKHSTQQSQSFDPIVDQLHSLSNHDSLAHASDSHGADQQLRHSLAEVSAVDRGSPSTAYSSEDLLLSATGGDSAFHDGHLPATERLANNAVNIREIPSNMVETVHQQPDLPPIRIEEVLVDEEGSHNISARSPILLSQCSSPGEDLRPGASMLSRLSYSSELVSVTSGSEPDSPVSPKSPAFDALYSPPGLPSRISGDMSASLPGIYTGLYSRSDHHSGDSSSLSEILVFSSPPKSPTSRAPWADEWEHEGPLRPPPPPPIVNILPDNSFHFERKEVVDSLNRQPYILASPSSSPFSDLSSTSLQLDSIRAQSNGGACYVSSFQDNAENVQAESSSRSPDNSDLQSPSSSRDLDKAPSSSCDEMQSSFPYLKAEEQSRSAISTPSATESSRSSSAFPFGLPDSTTMQPSQAKVVHSDLQHIPELRTVDDPSDEPAFDVDSVSPSGEEFAADPFSEDRQGRPSSLAFTDLVRSSLILPRRPSDSPSSTGHTSPLGSPKQHFQRISLTNPTPQPTSSPFGLAMMNGPSRFSVRDEESVPSSPTGSVIIRDTPSPPGSPASNYSGSESVVHKFHPSDYYQPKSPVSSPLVADALEDEPVNHEKTSSDEINVQEDPGSRAPQSSPASAVSGLSNSASKELDQAAYSLAEDLVETPAFDTSVRRDISHEKSPLHASPPRSLHLDTGPTGSVLSTEAAALRPLSLRSGSKSPTRSASNSPPDSPPRKEYLAGDGGALPLELRGRSKSDSPSKTGSTVPPASPDRSPSNSPPTSPPKLSDQASLLRWRRGSGRGSMQPGFLLPPNLVCRSETSSPPYSPPSKSDSESPTKWDEGSEVSSNSDSSGSSDSIPENQNEAAEVYRLSDSPLPIDSPTVSEEGECSSAPSSRSESDEEDNAAVHELEMVRTPPAEPAPEKPSYSSSDKQKFENHLSIPRSSYDTYEPSGTQVRSSIFESSTEPVSSKSLSQEDKIQQPTLENERNLHCNPGEFEPPPPPPAPGSADSPASKDALAAAIAHHDWNMMKALTFKDPGHRPLPPPDERSILLDQIRSESFSLHRSDDSLKKSGHVTRPSASINVAAILEKANAIRQAFVGSDDEDGDEDDWSDS